MGERVRLLLSAGLVVGLFAGLAAYSMAVDRDVQPRINEVVTSNAFGLVDGWGDHPDWIELHNPSSEVAELGGWGLNDSRTPDGAWRFPEGFSIGPDGHAVVFASGRGLVDPAGNLHTDFALDRQGDALVLVDPDDVVVDTVAVAASTRNRSWGRDPSDPTRWCRFLHPTPGEPNGDACWDDEGMGAPTLSLPSGFYDDPIVVEITPARSGDEVWYTLDGSYPDLVSNPGSTMVYRGPLEIQDRTPEPEHLSLIRVTYPRSILTEGPVPVTPTPQPDQPKATSVRARSADGAEAVATYFVGEGLRSDLPVVSLVFEEEYLFDDEDGILRPGAVFDDYVHGPDFDPRFSLTTPANFLMRGREWERPMTDRLHSPVWFEWCEPDRGCEYQAGSGVRVHGNASRTFFRKSLRLYARPEFGDERFQAPFFGPLDPIEGHRRLILRTGGNNHARSIIADAYLQSLMGHFDAETQAHRSVTLYLNGEYWGIHNLRERYDQHYLELVHGADPASVVVLDFGGLTVEVGDPAGLDPYLQLLDVLAETPPASRIARERIEAAMDVDSFFDFVIAHVFTGNRDWAGNNARAWRQPGGDGDGTLDGRWRWMIIDLDLAGEDRFDPTYDVFVGRLPPSDDRYFGGGIPLMFDRLMADPVYRDRFLNRFADHLNTTFLTERTVTELDRTEELLAPEIPNHVSRWAAPSSVEAWHGSIDRIRSFMQERPAIQWQQLVERFELEGTTQVTIRSDQDQGHVRLNSLHLREGTPGVFGPEDWRGDYFLGVPIRFEAIPAEDHRFVRWEGVPADMAEVQRLTRDVTGPITIRAVFEPTG